ncbi:SrfA family protein [Serratia sp. L9]|uniref:SrfA family protein n=1 Tax=Serratia sp. L9 TaxID=3423946 RepID=UPI003D67B196
MAKPFLRSGSLDDVLTLGENGQPVFAVALQLREALHLQQQQAAADCLAIPVPNEQGDRIDWYAPVAGQVTSWHAADETARTAALHQLERFQATARAISLRARNSGKSSQQRFAALLTKAMQFPDQNAVFLVAGKPVLTCWGFVKADGKTRTDPLDCLRPPDYPAEPTALPEVEVTLAPVAPVAAPAQIAPVVEKQPRRPGWPLPVLAVLAALIGGLSIPNLKLNPHRRRKPSLPRSSWR